MFKFLLRRARTAVLVGVLVPIARELIEHVTNPQPEPTTGHGWNRWRPTKH